jgi:hypothetical protein
MRRTGIEDVSGMKIANDARLEGILDVIVTERNLHQSIREPPHHAMVPGRFDKHAVSLCIHENLFMGNVNLQDKRKQGLKEILVRH